jgi:hypothetical protein
MQRCVCEVRLAGDLLNTVEKRGVSPAEVLILRHIHGDDSVCKFAPNGNDRGRAIDERGDLQERYPRYFAEVFPGATPQLPEAFKDIGVDLLADDETDAAPRRGRKPKAEAVDTGVAIVGADDLTQPE